MRGGGVDLCECRRVGFGGLGLWGRGGVSIMRGGGVELPFENFGVSEI